MQGSRSTEGRPTYSDPPIPRGGPPSRPGSPDPASARAAPARARGPGPGPGVRGRLPGRPPGDPGPGPFSRPWLGVPGEGPEPPFWTEKRPFFDPFSVFFCTIRPYFGRNRPFSGVLDPPQDPLPGTPTQGLPRPGGRGSWKIRKKCTFCWVFNNSPSRDKKFPDFFDFCAQLDGAGYQNPT